MVNTQILKVFFLEAASQRQNIEIIFGDTIYYYFCFLSKCTFYHKLCTSSNNLFQKQATITWLGLTQCTSAHFPVLPLKKKLSSPHKMSVIKSKSIPHGKSYCHLCAYTAAALLWCVTCPKILIETLAIDRRSSTLFG